MAQIKGDGTGVVPLSLTDEPWLHEESFEISCLSLSNGTCLAIGFSSYIVKLKPREQTACMMIAEEILNKPYSRHCRDLNIAEGAQLIADHSESVVKEELRKLLYLIKETPYGAFNKKAMRNLVTKLMREL